MKKNHEKLKAYISQAIQYCKEDYVFANIKRRLLSCLREVEAVEKKRINRNEQSLRYEEEAKKNNEKWMEMLKSGLRKEQYDEARIDRPVE